MKLQHVLYRLRSLTLSGLLKLVYLKIVGKEHIINGRCNNCGQCCRLINLKYEKGWIRSRQQFDELVNDSPEYKRFAVKSCDGNGYLQFSCSWLDDNYQCSNYEERLDICRKYPSKSLFLCGGKVLDGCGYTISEVVPFRKYLQKEIKKKNEKNSHN